MTLLPFYHKSNPKSHRTMNALLMIFKTYDFCATWNYDFIFYDFSEFSLSPRTISLLVDWEVLLAVDA